VGALLWLWVRSPCCSIGSAHVSIVCGSLPPRPGESLLTT